HAALRPVGCVDHQLDDGETQVAGGRCLDARSPVEGGNDRRPVLDAWYLIGAPRSEVFCAFRRVEERPIRPDRSSPFASWNGAERPRTVPAWARRSRAASQVGRASRGTESNA